MILVFIFIIDPQFSLSFLKIIFSSPAEYVKRESIVILKK